MIHEHAPGEIEFEVTCPLAHKENYGVYFPLAENKCVSINSSDLTKESWFYHYNSIMNVLRDGIEMDEVQKNFISILFADGVTLDLYVVDYYLNLIFWNMLIQTNTPIESKHVFFAKEITKNTIKDYIDRWLIEENRTKFSNKVLNNIIDDTLFRFHDINEFAFYLSNTVNLEDNIFLMDKCPEFYECMHADLSAVPIEDVKSVGMSYANKAISIMKDAKQYLGYDHCLADACRASEGINPKQFKEFTINIGTKPNGHGGVFEKAILTSFINGGVSTPIDYFIESSTGRTAQIIKFNNVGESGSFARLLGLNNMDSRLNEDPHYDCHSDNFVEIVIENKKILKMLNNRYYRLYPNGIEMRINARNDSHLIGQKIYLRSPITCASAAKGKGICYKCYGDLAYTVFDSDLNFGVNIGRIASETLSSSLTQKLLSAKHLLETFVEKVTWVDKFYELFEIEGNVIRVESEADIKGLKLVIDPESIELENEEDDDLTSDDDTPIFNEYITEFGIFDGAENIRINNDKDIKLYISNELNSVIRRKGQPLDGMIYIDLSELKACGTLFLIQIENNELSKTLKHLEHLLNKNDVVKGMDINSLVQNLFETIIDGGLNIASTHMEVIVSNQIRDAEDILKKPEWWRLNPSYEILTLNKALTCNPSVTISLSYQKIGKMLYNPLTYKKDGASFMDLFFMEKPQYAIRGIEPPEEEEEEMRPGDCPIIMLDDPNKITVAEEEIIDCEE